MAKNRRIVREQVAGLDRHRSDAQASHESAITNAKDSPLFSRATGIRWSVAAAAAAIVYAAYWTHDSIEVSQGAARYLVALLLVTSAIAFASFKAIRPADIMVDALAWSLAAWMVLSLMVNANQANVRLGINELGWWLATAALLSIARRVAALPIPANALLRLIITVSVGIAIYGWHQLFVGFPEMIAQYEANPEAMLRQIGIVAEENSSMRITFENRLYDGGPTGTFALANSMAAMLAGGLVAMFGWLFVQWSDWNRMRRAVWIFGTAIVGSMVLAARSRSAIVAIGVVGLWLVVTHLRHREWFEFSVAHRRRIVIGVVAFFGLGVVSLLYVFRNSEWVQQAPASLAIRFRYWVACFEMTRQAPWFGVGPGQFKSSYEAFRAETSTEQIADPHQFLLQTLTAGGIPSLLILMSLLGLMIWIYRQRRTNLAGPSYDASHGRGKDAPEQVSMTSVAMAGIVATAGMWILGAAVGQLPSVEPAIFATVSAIIFSIAIWYRGNEPVRAAHRSETKRIAGYSAFVIGVDLLASGGMTVPGVSVIAWMLVGIAVPVMFAVDRDSSDEKAQGTVQKTKETVPFSFVRLVSAVAVFAVTVIWYVVGIVPIETSKREQNRFTVAWKNGQVENATASLEAAAAADPWDSTPVLQLANAYRSLAAADPSRRKDWEVKWLAAEAQASTRANRDPIMKRQLGDQRLFYYQRFGDRAMLKSAEQWYSQAVQLAPSNESHTAQWAEVLRELGDPRAKEIALRAERLSLAGGYYERMLGFTMIYEARVLGTDSPEPIAAENALEDLLSSPGEPDPTG